MEAKVVELLSWASMLSKNKGESLKEDYSINIGTIYNAEHTNSVCKLISFLIAEMMDKEKKTDLIMTSSVDKFYGSIYDKVLWESLDLLHENERSSMHNIKSAIDKSFAACGIRHKRLAIHRFKNLGVSYRRLTDNLISGYPVLLKYSGKVYLIKGYKVFSNNSMYLEVIGNYEARYKTSYIDFKDIGFFSYMLG